ncbi:HlyD family secretion protein [Bradyrhizobium sp. McL0616]|uniref:HlyD family secretion protein n=1 Tax=Bradyrhizobium sp. McL0616 TaxID=3415674 RepID=UPI003CEE5CFC
MAVLLLLIYAAICVAIFKILRVPLNQWSVTAAGIVGVVIVGGLLAGMNYNHPFTTDARLYFFTTPIVPQVKGRIVEVPAKPNVALKKGDPLFKIDPAPYQFVVDQKKAALAEAEQGVKQLKASLDQASAGLEKATAQLSLAQANYDRQNQLFQAKDIAQAALDTAQRNLEAAKQTVAEARAVEERARLAYTSDVGGVNTTVARLSADLRDSQYDLDQTTVVAPTDGYVTQLFLRPGMLAASTPAMVFIHSDDRIFSASFPQTVVQRLRPGAEAEIAFDAIPGRVFRGKVDALIDAVSQGQLQATGTLLNPEDRAKSPGLASVNIGIVDDLSTYQLPAGTTAQVAVYSDHWGPVAAIRRILLRMKSWLNYVL